MLSRPNGPRYRIDLAASGVRRARVRYGTRRILNRRWQRCGKRRGGATNDVPSSSDGDAKAGGWGDQANQRGGASQGGGNGATGGAQARAAARVRTAAWPGRCRRRRRRGSGRCRRMRRRGPWRHKRRRRGSRPKLCGDLCYQVCLERRLRPQDPMFQCWYGRRAGPVPRTRNHGNQTDEEGMLVGGRLRIGHLLTARIRHDPLCGCRRVS